MQRTLRDRLAVFMLVTFLGACASGGQFVWVQNYPVLPAGSEAFTIEPGDQLSIQVWKADQMSGRQRVRDDGRISLFFAADLKVAGLTTSQVADSIAARLVGVVASPQVNVMIEQATASTISVLGEVVHPGQFPVHEAPTVLAALSLASGLTEYAHRDRLYVLRRSPQVTRIRFTYEQLTRGEDVARGFRLRPGDAVIVE